MHNHCIDNQLRTNARLATQQIFLADMVDWRRTLRHSTRYDQKQNLRRSRSGNSGLYIGEVFVREIFLQKNCKKIWWNKNTFYICNDKTDGRFIALSREYNDRIIRKLCCFSLIVERRKLLMNGERHGDRLN